MTTLLDVSHSSLVRFFVAAGVVCTALVLSATPSVYAVPEIDRPVTDRVGVYADHEVDDLERRLYDLQERTGVQMAVLVVDSTRPEPIESYSMAVAERWEGGSAERDDGVLFTLAIDDRQNRLELGYGLEPVLSDSEAADILDSIAPLLREERYADATREVIDEVDTRTAHLAPGQPIEAAPFRPPNPTEFFSTKSLSFGLAVVVFLLFGFVVGRRHRIDDWRQKLIDLRIHDAEVAQRLDAPDFELSHLQDLKRARDMLDREERSGTPADLDSVLDHPLPDVPSVGIVVFEKLGRLGTSISLGGIFAIALGALLTSDSLGEILLFAAASGAAVFVGLTMDAEYGDNFFDALISSVLFGGAFALGLTWYVELLTGDNIPPGSEGLLALIHGIIAVGIAILIPLLVLGWCGLYAFLRPDAPRTVKFKTSSGGNLRHGGRTYSFPSGTGGGTYSSAGTNAGSVGFGGGGGGFSGGGGSFGGGGASGSW